MNTSTIVLVLFLAFIAIPNIIIDHKHRKKGGRGIQNAWTYYSNLNKEGSWEGRYMMWSRYITIFFAILFTVLVLYSII